MGVASTLFYNGNDLEAEMLYSRISPSEEQMTEQRARWNNLAEFLIERLGEYTSLTITSWLQGSYKFGTQVRPMHTEEEYDIDLGIYYGWTGKPAGSKYSPYYLKSLVQTALEEYALANKDEVIEVVAPPKMRCSRIRFEGNFHIDVPCYHLDSDTDTRRLATENDEWEISDPQAFYGWFKDAYEDEYLRAKVRRHIQYIKAWACLTFKKTDDRPSSVLITVLISQAFDTLSETERSSDDEALSTIVNEICRRIANDTKVLNPANTSEDLGARLSQEQWDAVAEEFNKLKAIATNAVNCTSQMEAAIKWGEAFGHFFPLPDAELAKSEAGNALVTFQFNPRIAVTATKSGRSWNGINEVGPIPPGCSIEFDLQNYDDLPPYSTVEWVVRNARGDAEYLNQLGHDSGSGRRPKIQRSEFNGRHSMDCIVRQYGKVIGVQRVLVNIQGAVIPRRVPIPTYRKFNRSR